MADTAQPAAPAATSATSAPAPQAPSNPSGGPGTVAASPPAAVQPNPPARQRGPDGKFLPSTPAQGELLPQEGEAPKRWRLGEEEFDSPDALATRAAQLREEAEAARAYKGLLESAYKAQQEAERQRKAMEEDPEGYLRKAKGWDPIEAGKKAYLEELLRRKKYADVPEEFRSQLEEYETLKQKTQEYEAKEKERGEREAKEKADREFQAEQAELVSTIQAVWEGLELPQHPFLMGLAAEEYRAQKLAGLKPNPALIAKELRESFFGAYSAYDTDERFDAAAYIKKYPKRAEAIRLAALQGAGVALSPQGQRTSAQKPEQPKVDPVDRFNEVWNTGRR